MNETQSRDLMVELAASLFARGFSVGSAGNISMRIDDGYLITPTNSSLGRLDPVRIAKLDKDFRHVAGDRPSKEVFMHRAFYVTRADAGAIVHLHSTLATAVACFSVWLRRILPLDDTSMPPSIRSTCEISCQDSSRV